jgi:hypothetical protein
MAAGEATSVTVATAAVWAKSDVKAMEAIAEARKTKTKTIGMAAQVVKMVAAMVTEACRTDRRVGNLSHPHLP